MQARSAIVVGSGIAGMTAAFRLKQAGYSVRVLEAESEIGGRMSTRRRDGFTFDRAATLLAGPYRFLAELIAELGLKDRIEYRHFSIGTFRAGKVHALRSDHILRDSLFSGLLSWRSKLLMMRVMVDAVRARPLLSYADLSVAAPLDVESAKDYALRRLNAELLDYVVDPAIAAMVATDAEHASVVNFLFIVSNYIGVGAYRYEGGVDFLVEELARRVPVEIGACVQSVVEREDHVEIHWERGGVPCTERCAVSVIAVPAPKVTALYSQLTSSQQQIINDYQYTSCFAGHFGLSSPPNLDADLVQIPPCESPGLVTLYQPHRIGRSVVPPGQAMVVGFFSNAWCRERTHLSDDDLLEAMIGLIEPLIPNIRQTIVLTSVDRWSPGLFSSGPGTIKAMAAFKAQIKAGSRVQLAGDYFSFCSTNASAMSGDAAARRIIENHP
jgi:oxygen-dependent protoporphyrinogen oxidase